MKPAAPIFAACLLACVASGGAFDAAARKAEVTSKDYAAPALPHGHVILPDAFGGLHRLEVELAMTPESRERGLMWRTQLADTAGMLFIFPEEEVQNFWMRNTLIPLDLIFIDQQKRVVGIVSRAEPKTLTGRGVNHPTLYVLEVPGGWTEKMGVRPGVRAHFEGVPFGPSKT